MSNERLNLCYLLIGNQGTGKTTIADKLAAASNKRRIVVDTDAHPFYADYPVVNITGLKTFKGNKCRCEDANEDELFTILNAYQRNAFIIFEDAFKYISPNMSKAVISFIIDKRKRNFDICFMFHSLADVPPYLCKNYQRMILFKTQDNLKKELSKFSNWHIIKEKAEQINKHPSHNYCEAIFR